MSFSSFYRTAGHESPTTVYTCLVRDVPFHRLNITRAGGILVCGNSKQLFIGLGTDRRSGQLTDFAGRVESQDAMSKFHPAIVAALREISEELLFILGVLTPAQVDETPCLYDDANFVILLRVPWLPPLPTRAGLGYMYINDIFARVHADAELAAKRNETAPPEVRDIEWYTPEEFAVAVSTSLSTTPYETGAPGTVYTTVASLMNRGLTQHPHIFDTL